MTERSSGSTEELAALFQNGDERAFAVLIERLRPMIRREMSRIRCNRSDTDDLAQEALLGVLAAAKSFSPQVGAEFVPFARVCVRRRLLNAVQKLTTPELPQEHDTLLRELARMSDPSVADPGERLMLREEDAAFLKRLRDHLSPMEYAVLMLHLSAYSYEEIASARGLSVKSVDNALQRVRKKLARLL